VCFVPQSSSHVVNELLAKLRAGDQEALDALVPLLYSELRRAAHRYLRDERPGHTLQSTALVHEVYLRLRKQECQEFENRAHFLAIAAQLMRQVLVEYARSRNAAKRDGGRRLTLDDNLELFKTRSVDLVSLDDALNELSRLDPRQSRVVELRFFGGLSTEETSAVLGISPATVKRDWATARVWLLHEMSRSGRHDPGALAAG
jgi:RNA polymerase sigma factor (TIGR02999 family)